MPDVTNAALAALIEEFVDSVTERDELFYDWSSGTATGGPGGDGRYPLRDHTGNTRLVPSPEKLAQIFVKDQVSGLLNFATWAELDAHPVVGLATGAGAKVYADPGSHADQVTGGTVPNGGVYRLVVPDKWQRIANLEAGDAVSAIQPSLLLAQAAAASAEAANTSAPVVRGLIYKFEGSLAGWIGATDAWSIQDKPALVGFDRSAVPAQLPGPGSDAGGIRESCIFVEPDGTWYMFYGAGDGSQGPGGPWRVQLSRSADQGVNWDKLGPLNMGLSHGYDAGSYPATDMLHIEKRGGKYLLHRMSAGGAALNQVPDLPYESDLWEADEIEGPYTFVRRILQLGAPGAFDASTACASSVVLHDSIYHLFYSGTLNGEYYVGLATSSSPKGPFIKTGVPVVPNRFYAGQGENPKVFWWAAIARWAMITNQVIPGQYTPFNRILLSKDLRDWSHATYCDFTPISPMAGKDAIGLTSGFYSDRNVPLIDLVSNPDGSYPYTYDTDPTDGNHIGRKLYYGALEGSARGLTSAASLFGEDFSGTAPGALGGQNGWVDDSRTNPKPQIIAGGVLDLGSAPGSGGRQPSVVRAFPAGSIAQKAVVTIGADCGVAFAFAHTEGPGLGQFFYCAFGGGTNGIQIAYFDNGVGTLMAANGSLGAGLHVCEAAYNAETGEMILYIDLVPFFGMVFSAPQRARMAAGGNVGLLNSSGGTGQRHVTSYEVSAPVVAATAPIILPRRHGPFVVEFAVRPERNVGYQDFFYHLQAADNVDSGYRLRLDMTNGGATCNGLYKRASRTEKQIAGATNTRTQKSSVNGYVTVRVSVQANTHTVWINGEKQFQASDSTFTAGLAFALAGKGQHRIDALSIRKGRDVVVNGVTAGQVVTMRGPGGFPLATKAAIGTSVTLAVDHYPATSITVGNAERIAPKGGIWGGSIFEV